MNFFDMLWLLFFAGLCCIGCIVGNAIYGWIGGIAGLAVVIAGVVLLLQVFGYVTELLRQRRLEAEEARINALPHCKKCGAKLRHELAEQCVACGHEWRSPSEQPAAKHDVGPSP